ncbi:transketolase [Methanospirillum sp.]|uniref:transketolase n=1 Tax=Methanospirillum sp. TaxID=45200 RepID=UPI0026373529|nr:transketolase [Methanospirillum sp.]
MKNNINLQSLHSMACQMRGEIIEIAHNSDAMHIGSCLSSLDIILTLYHSVLSFKPEEPEWKDRDRFILSKGHASLALYVVLASRGFFPKELLHTFNRTDSFLTEHPVRGNVHGIEASTGSLGHGPGIGLGMALAAKISGNKYRSFVLMSDGECNEGTVWEAVLLAPVQKLGNLIFIVDNNGWQATGRCDDIMHLNPLADKFKTFGWNSFEVDGHNFEELLNIFHSIPVDSEKPTAIIAHTVKGKGVSFMEGDNNWHYRIPTADDVTRAKAELGLE